MSINRDTANRYLDGFRRNDHAQIPQILSRLADDIRWTVYGAFRAERERRPRPDRRAARVGDSP